VRGREREMFSVEQTAFNFCKVPGFNGKDIVENFVNNIAHENCYVRTIYKTVATFRNASSMMDKNEISYFYFVRMMHDVDEVGV